MSKGFSLIASSTLVLASILLVVLFATSQASARPSWAQAAKPGGDTIASVASGDENFSTLVAALSCTGLVEAVDGKRQLTVFAPTNAAFFQLGLTAENICEEYANDKDALTNILLYHVINGRRTSQSVLAAPSYRTLSGERLTQNELDIVAADISARNGVIHVIDTVLLP